MRLLTRGRLITLVIAIALLAINVVAIRWSSQFFTAKQARSLVRYENRITDLKGRSLTGKGTIAFGSNSPASLVLYFSLGQPPGFSTELVKYAETLSQRHKKDGLVITAIVQHDIIDLRTLIDHSLLTYDVIIDEDRKIQDRLGLGATESGVFLFDKDGACRFSTRRPVTADDLRQLVAAEFLKTDPLRQPPESDKILKRGESLAAFALLDARSLSPTSVEKISAAAGAPTHYIFFTADCSVCSLPQYLEQFKEFQKTQLKGDAVLIFDFNFGRADVLDQLDTKTISTPAYIAKEQLPDLEYSDEGQRLQQKSVAVIQTDTARIVSEIYPLQSRRAGQKTAAVAKQEARPAYEEMFGNIPFTAYDVAAYQGKYFLTDFEGNRVLVVKGDMALEREFGRIGSGPGRLFHPGYLDVGRDGTIFVEDGGNERIVKFDQSGNYLGELRLAAYQGMALGQRNEIFVGQPENGHLVTVYSGNGKQLRSFGQLKKFSDVYGETAREKDEAFKIAFNRVRLSTDADGNVYVSFMLTPLIQKYSADGKLLLERRLEAPEIDRLFEAIHKRKHIATHSDGADARIIALDPVVDPANGNILVPLVDGMIYVADREGNKISLLQPTWIRRGDGTFYPFVAGLGAKGELLVTPFPPARWYRLAMPATTSEATVAAR